MRPRINVITLGVDDLERALAFYGGALGLESDGIIGTEFEGSDESPAGATVMFHLDGGLVLSLYPRTELAKDAHMAVHPPSPVGFSIGHFVDSREEVDALLQAAAAAGGHVTAPAHDRPWGIYSGYFQDPDGHLWEIIYAPGAGAP
ncbi:MAG TPA: VOC family protein [Acidimicrobiales bacterium]|nr:VOC family protein [Acidimicrobiales bacterium]